MSEPMKQVQALSSPRTWRCFRYALKHDLIVLIFSTHVEVFLSVFFVIACKYDLLHARGGVSLASSVLVEFS